MIISSTPSESNLRIFGIDWNFLNLKKDIETSSSIIYKLKTLKTFFKVRINIKISIISTFKTGCRLARVYYMLLLRGSSQCG